MMASSFDISGPGSRQGDDDSSGSDREMQEHGGSKQFRESKDFPAYTTSSALSFLHGHIEAATAVVTTLALSFAVWLQFAVIYPVIFPQNLVDAANPTKKNWSKQNCNLKENMERALKLGDPCPCWDGLFKGTYVAAEKKSFMFNIETESLGIFALTVMFTCVTYAGFKTVFQLFLDGQLRVAALLPILANVHGVYYHWYVSFTYMNDSWYNYWYSQWVFGITEFVVMYILFLRLDTRYQLKVEHAAAVIAIATFHTSQGMLTQAINNLVNWHGTHLVARDFAFVFAEVFCVATIVSDTRALAAIKGRPILSMWPNLLKFSVGGFVCLWVLLSFTNHQENRS